MELNKRVEEAVVRTKSILLESYAIEPCLRIVRVPVLKLRAYRV